MTVPWKWMTAYTWRVCFNWSRVHNWLTILMGVGTMRTINQRTILERIQEMNDLLSYLMMNQATLHLGALSSLINSESSNHRGQPKMGTAFITERMTSTWMSQCIEKQRRLCNAKKATLWRWSIKEGGPIFQKVRCIAYHLTSHALHICFADISWNKIPTGIQRDSHELTFF